MFSDSIVARLPNVAVLLSVLTPAYRNSEWCKRELQEFFRASAATGGVRVADKMRVFKVVKTPVPREDEPTELQPVLGYEFYTMDPETHRTRQLVATPEVHSLYWTRLDDLANDIADLITSLEREARHPQPDEPTPGAVYLAEASYDLKERRDTIRRDLQSHGYTVVPDRPLPGFGPDYISEVRAHLARCRLSVHMVGRSYGSVPDGSTDSVVALQHELAIERAALGNFRRLIWMPPDLSTDDERQRQFIDQLETDSRVQSAADLLKLPSKTSRACCTPGSSPQHRRHRRSPASDRSTYVVCEQRDREAVRPLVDFLYNQGFEVISSAFDGDQTSILQDHRDNLVTCDAVLVYYGAGNELWLRTQLRELTKSPGYGRTRPMLATAVLVAPPMNDEKARYRSHEAVVIKSGPQLSPPLFDPFLDRLR